MITDGAQREMPIDFAHEICGSASLPQANTLCNFDYSIANTDLSFVYKANFDAK